MSATTTRVCFEALLPGHRVVPVIRELFAAEETPVGVYRKLAEGRPGTFLLESAEQGGIWSRYSFVGVGGFGQLTAQNGSVSWADTGLSVRRAFGGELPAHPLEAVEALHATWRTPKIPGHPPLTGGLVGFLGWETVRLIERLPDAPAPDYGIPELVQTFVSELAVLDHRTGAVLLVVSALADGQQDADELWTDAQRRLDALEKRLARPAESWLAEAEFDTVPAPQARVGEDEFHAMVASGKKHIQDGDVFQVVLSHRFDHEVTADPLDVYRVLRSFNPSPYMYFFSLQDAAGAPLWVVGSSPEALVKVEDGRVLMHPIAGSKPRGRTPEEDVELAEKLANDRKEQAEHLMLVDLARNDLAKVCEPGSVEVTEFMQVERFSHIMHLVSSVEGDLRTAASPVDVFRATFPAGTLSGAPKPRALELIDTLEPAQRGLYGGVVGYFGFSGDLDLAIAIRTMTISDGLARVQAGAGIVADSVAESEHDEVRNKAAAPLRAIAVANALRRIGRP